VIRQHPYCSVPVHLNDALSIFVEPAEFQVVRNRGHQARRKLALCPQDSGDIGFISQAPAC
jgi:hypothetical protein